MRTWIVIALILCFSTLAAPAAAQIDGKAKLALDFNGFTFASYDDGVGDANTELSIGPFAPVRSVYSGLIGVPPVGLDVGFGASDSVVIGALLRLGVSKLDAGGGGSETLISVGFMPHIDYVFSPHSSFRPFVGAVGGISLLDGSVINPDSSATFASIGAAVGGYGFVGNSFSIGPRLVLSYSPGVSSDVEDLSVLAVQIVVELAGWM